MLVDGGTKALGGRPCAHVWVAGRLPAIQCMFANDGFLGETSQTHNTMGHGLNGCGYTAAARSRAHLYCTPVYVFTRVRTLIRCCRYSSRAPGSA